MTTQQSYSINATRAIEKLARTMKAIQKDPSIEAYMREAPESLTEGKSLYQIAMEDVRAAFEAIFKGCSDQEIPYEIYESILRHTDTKKYKEIKAIENTKTRKEAIWSVFHTREKHPYAAQYLYKNAFDGEESLKNPRYLAVLAGKIDLESLELLGQDHVNMLGYITEASLQDSLHRVFSRNADLQGHVKDMVDRIYEQETAPEGDDEYEDEYADLHKDHEANAENGYEEEADLKSTVLDPYTEQLISLYGKELRQTVDKKHKARMAYAEKKKIDVQDVLYTPVDEHLLDFAETLMMTPTHSSLIMVAEKGMDTSGVVKRIAEHLYHDTVPQKLLGARVIQLDLEMMVNYLSKTPAALQDPSIDTGKISATRLDAHLHVLFSRIDMHNKSGRPPIYLSIKGFEQAVKPKSILGGKLEEWFTYWLGEEKDVRIIAEVSQNGMDSIKKEAPDLYKLLNTYKVKEPNEQETVARIKDWLYFGRGKTFSENYYFSDNIIEAAVKLSNKHVNKSDEAQPGLTTSIITLAATAAELRNSEEITLDDIVEAISTRSGKTRDMILTNQNERMATVNANVKANLINQDHAVDKICESIDLLRMNRKAKSKPIGAYILAGPTGVGKTETAELIAKYLGAGLISIDMSNYTEKLTVTQLLGASPNYIGYGEKTPLEAVEENEINVVLLDEFEKAHPDIYKAFMAPLDKGRLTLGSGKTLDLTNTLFLLTTNAGEKDKEFKPSVIGFNLEEDQEVTNKEAVMNALKATVPPEFLNRTNDTIIYNELNAEAVRFIAQLKINKLAQKYKDEELQGELVVSDEALDQLAELGFVPGMGARPLERAIEKYIDLPLGRWCLDNPDKNPMDYKFTVESITPEFKVHVEAANEDSVSLSPANENTTKVSKPAQPKLG